MNKPEVNSSAPPNPPIPTTASSLAELARSHDLDEVSVALGVFDGVHRGHQSIIQALREAAVQTNSAPVVVSFAPHPRTILTPGNAPLLLTRENRRARLLMQYGVKAVVFLPFTRELATLPPEVFLERYLFSGSPRIRSICVGQDWRFGNGGSGDVNLLQRFATRQGTAIRTVPSCLFYRKPISSTRIRRAVREGRLPLAARLLNRPHAVSGRVLRGKGIGGPVFQRKTANVDAAGLALPPAGVYAVKVRLPEMAAPPDDTLYGGIAYIGPAPTVTGPENTAPCPWVETHIFDFDRVLYGRELEVEFAAFLRTSHAFPSTRALREQIERDVRQARQITTADT